MTESLPPRTADSTRRLSGYRTLLAHSTALAAARAADSARSVDARSMLNPRRCVATWTTGAIRCRQASSHCASSAHLVTAFAEAGSRTAAACTTRRMFPSPSVKIAATNSCGYVCASGIKTWAASRAVEIRVMELRSLPVSIRSTSGAPAASRSATGAGSPCAGPKTRATRLRFFARGTSASPGRSGSRTSRESCTSYSAAGSLTSSPALLAAATACWTRLADSMRCRQ